MSLGKTNLFSEVPLRYILFTALVFVLVACSGMDVSKNDYNKVRMGMSRKDVDAILKVKPSCIEDETNIGFGVMRMSSCTYGMSANIIFDNGRVMSKSWLDF